MTKAGIDSLLVKGEKLDTNLKESVFKPDRIWPVTKMVTKIVTNIVTKIAVFGLGSR